MTSGVCDIHAVMHVRIFSTTRLRITNLSIKSEKIYQLHVCTNWNIL